MNVAKLKVGQKVAVTELITRRDTSDLSIGMVGTVRYLGGSNELYIQFPCDNDDSRYMLYRQLRKYKEPKHLKLKVGDEVKIRNYKKYPELCVDSNRHYPSSMEQFIGTKVKVKYVHSDGSVMLDNGWNYCTPTLKHVKAPKPKDITVGSKVRVTKLIGLDSYHGIMVGQEYTITRHGL